MNQAQRIRRADVISPVFSLCLIALAAGFLLVFISYTPLAGNLELRTLDYRFAGRDAGIPASDRIVIIALDDASFAAIDEPFLFWYPFLAEVVNRLVEAGAGVVGIDMIQQVSIEEYRPGSNRSMQMATLSGRVVLIAYLPPEGRIRYPIRPLMASAGVDNIALGNLTPDQDGVIRRQAIHMGPSTSLQVPCFPFLVTARYLNREMVQGDDGRYRLSSGGDGGSAERYVQENNGLLAINFAGPPNTFRQIPFHQVLERAQAGDRDYFERNFRDRIVLIGRTDLEGKDLLRTPFSVLGYPMSGIELHANTINTLLKQAYLVSGQKIAIFSTFLLCFITAFLCYYLRPLRGTLISCFALTLYWYATFQLFRHYGYLLDLVAPTLSVPLVFAAAFLFRYLTIDRRMGEIRDVFGKLVSANVAEELWKDRLEPRPGRGEEKTVTVLFSDINDFTPKCARHSAAEIMEMLNDYFNDMVEVVFKNNGTVGKYVGDEIMVMFGAPHQEPRQALLAVKTAVEMVRRLGQLKAEKGEPGFYETKIGIHTGKMVVGFLGSPQRMEYTTIGESVNLAARVEALNKRLGTTILISEATWLEIMEENQQSRIDDLPGVEFVNRGLQELKGFERPVTVYEVVIREV